MDAFLKVVNKDQAKPFDKAEGEAIAAHLQHQNKVMYQKGVLHKV